MAREKAPTIKSISEIDAIGAKRMSMDTTGDCEVRRMLMQLLAEMDGFNVLEDISIIVTAKCSPSGSSAATLPRKIS